MNKGDNILRALRAIRNAGYCQKDENKDNLKNEVYLLCETLDLDWDSVVIVSVLFFGSRDFATLQALTNLHEITLEGTLDTLFKNNVVESTEDVWMLTKDAVKAIHKGEPIPPKPFDDCYGALRAARQFSVTTTWVLSFNRGLLLPANEKLKVASEELGITSLPMAGQMDFWKLAIDFIANGTKGVPQIDDEYDVGLLTKAGLSVFIPGRDENDVDRYVLSPNAAGALFQGRDDVVRYDDISKSAQVVLAKNIAPKELYYSSETLEKIATVRTLVSQEGYAKAKTVLAHMDRPASVQVLLWGPPGTGKTEICRQLARESGRDLFVVDSARVTGQYMGQSEKMWRSLFLAYNSIAMVSSKVPILLLNEADSVLSKRVAVEKSIDKTENAITDVILQEIESMGGILIATTNYTDSIDDAFDRRFLFKIEVGQPDALAREKIWLANIPELKQEEAKSLSEEFRMTGAQIGNVAVKRDIAEIYYDGDRGLEYIQRLCEQELALERKKKGHSKKIGF